MNDYTLLYYPNFHPNAGWLRRVLLLSDSVARIVPTDVNIVDPEGLRMLQDSIPGCLKTISPETRDVAIEMYNMPRLAKSFAILARSRKKRSRKEIRITIAKDGSISIAGHVFLHNAKISPKIHEQLDRNGLILRAPFARKVSWLYRKQRVTLFFLLLPKTYPGEPA